jgi:lysophospholipase L1-like esterase
LSERQQRPGAIISVGRSAARRYLRLVFGTYIVLLHAALLVLVFKTNFLWLADKTLGLVPSDEWNPGLVSRILEQAEEDVTVPPGRVVLVGDSMVAALDARLVADDAVNFGIGGDTTRTLYARLPVIRSIQQSRAVVVEVGVNDLKYRPTEQIARDYDAMLNRVAASPVIFALSVLPVDENGPAARQRPYLRNERIAALNSAIKRVCEARVRCRFIDVGSAMAASGVYGGDGWHHSAEGNRVLAQIIWNALHAAK